MHIINYLNICSKPQISVFNENRVFMIRNFKMTLEEVLFTIRVFPFSRSVLSLGGTGSGHSHFLAHWDCSRFSELAQRDSGAVTQRLTAPSLSSGNGRVLVKMLTSGPLAA